MSLEALEQDPGIGRIDPIRLLGVRYAAIDETPLVKVVANGGGVNPDALVLLERFEPASATERDSSCTPYVQPSTTPLTDGEVVALLHGNKLMALYGYEGGSGLLKSRCGFSTGVSRGII